MTTNIAKHLFPPTYHIHDHSVPAHKSGAQTTVIIPPSIVPINEHTNPPVCIPPINPSRLAIEAITSPIIPKINPKNGPAKTREQMPRAKDALAFPLAGCGAWYPP